MNAHYFESIAFYAGFVLNVCFVTLSFWGVGAFWPRSAMRGNFAAAWLILAIWIGFLSIGINVFYWRIFGDLSIRQGWLDAEDIAFYGRYYGDFFWKTLGCASIYLHFFARWKSIPLDEQKDWTPLLMGFYPDLSHWAVRIGNRMQALFNLKRKDT